MLFYLIFRENWDKVFIDPLILKDIFYPTGNPIDKPGKLKIKNFQGDCLLYLSSEFPDYSKIETISFFQEENSYGK